MTPVKETHTTASPEETEALGAELAKGFKAGDIVGLCGELGAGKTCLVRGIADGLGFKGYVKSPSFTIIHIYNGGDGGEGGRLPLYHIDLYRIRSERELIDAGIEEYIYGKGVSVIEWADKSPEVLKRCGVILILSVLSNDRREITIERKA